jgi:hypothetical protein
MSLEGKSAEEIANLAAISDDLLSDPKYGPAMRRLLKAKNPNLSMPDIELEDKARAEFAKQNQKIEDLKAEREQDKAQSAVNTLYESLRDGGVVKSRADFSELVKWASENGFMTSETGLRKAAMQRELEHEGAEPTPSMGGAPGFEIAEGELGKAFMKDPAGTARTTAMKAMDELRKARASGTKAH